MPKISIIMPAKNAEKWIEETLNSIVGQSFNDWELICIDDHSIDKTFETIRNFSLIDDRIRVLKNEQSGIIPALRLGLNRSSGLYITRMDADDIMPEDRLTILHNQLERSPIKTVVTGKVEYFSQGEVSTGYKKYEQWLNGLIDNDNHWSHIYRECVIASPNWMTRKSDLIKFRIFDEMVYPEDYSMCFQWKNNGFSVIGIDRITLLWREHPERTSRNSETYAQRSFFELKSKWYINEFKAQSIAILGAGEKGKLVAKQLILNELQFDWHDLNAEQYNTKVLDQKIQDISAINADQLIICVYPEKLSELIEFIESIGYQIGINAWFF